MGLLQVDQKTVKETAQATKVFIYIFKSIKVLEESEEQVRYSRSDSTMKSEPLFSA